MPRSAPVPAAPGPGAPAVASAPRGDMRRRIVALLQEYPEGLSPVQTRQLLGVGKDLGQTMKAMARDGLLRRVGTGGEVGSPPRAGRGGSAKNGGCGGHRED